MWTLVVVVFIVVVDPRNIHLIGEIFLFVVIVVVAVDFVVLLLLLQLIPKTYL